MTPTASLWRFDYLLRSRVAEIRLEVVLEPLHETHEHEQACHEQQHDHKPESLADLQKSQFWKFCFRFRTKPFRSGFTEGVHLQRDEEDDGWRYVLFIGGLLLYFPPNDHRDDQRPTVLIFCHDGSSTLICRNVGVFGPTRRPTRSCFTYHGGKNMDLSDFRAQRTFRLWSG